MILSNGVVFADGKFIRADVRIENGVIAQIADHLPGEGVDLKGGFLLPGLIDSHTHGHGGVDAMQGAHAALKMSKAYAKYGVTSFLPTTASAPPVETAETVRSIAECMGKEEGAEILGIHLEGPFFCAQRRGAHRENMLLNPSIPLLKEICGGHMDKIRILALAPELDGADDMIRYATGHGIAVSAGHTDASYERMEEAVREGVTRVTHLFNGMNPLAHREPGVPAAALNLREIFPELIADGIHVHPAVLSLSARQAGERLCLITDSMMATGMSDGLYGLGGRQVTVTGGVARTGAGNLAGSTLTLDRALRNMRHLAHVPPEKAVPMATENVARSLGLADRGRIAVGLRADLCLMDSDFIPLRTWRQGKSVYPEGL